MIFIVMKKFIKFRLKNILIEHVNHNIFNKNDMIKFYNATGSLDIAEKKLIPINKITGLDPEPSDWTDDYGNVKQFKKGEKINTPIEVIYDSVNNIYYLQNGNHRVKQAKINGDKYIEALVEPNNQNEKRNLMIKYKMK